MLYSNYILISNQNNFNKINSNSNNKINNIFHLKENQNFIFWLKTNPIINSYIYLFDYLSFEKLLNVFSYILNNINIFIANNQSSFLIDKIKSLYKSDLYNEKYRIKNVINERIYSFILSFLSKRVFSLIQTENYISTKIGYPKNNFIFIEIKNEFINYAYNRLGCILIQSLFPLGNEIQKQEFLNIIFKNCKEIIVNKYGHYLLNYLLYKVEKGEKYFNPIFNIIINDIKRYSYDKYSSVIIERLLDSSNENIINRIIQIVCKDDNDVVDLLFHPYGNYVLQKIIKITKDINILEMIYKTVNKNKNSLYNLSYGKKIMKEISAAFTIK